MFKKKKRVESSSLKKPKKTSNKKQVVTELSDIAKTYSLRVSNPYGYYPDDVDKILESLTSQVQKLSKENSRLTAENVEISQEKQVLQTELSKLKLDISLMEIPDTSTEEDFQMMGKLSNINESVGNVEVEVPEEENIPPLDDELEVIDLEDNTEEDSSSNFLSGFEIIE